MLEAPRCQLEEYDVSTSSWNVAGEKGNHEASSNYRVAPFTSVAVGQAWVVKTRPPRPKLISTLPQMGP